MSIHAPWISHLLFADDCLVFVPATKRSADRVASILHDYHQGSGQLVNKQKSAIFFSDNCQTEDRTAVHDSLGIENEALGENIWDYQHQLGRCLMECSSTYQGASDNSSHGGVVIC